MSVITSFHSQFERDPADPLDLVGVVDLGIHRALLAVTEIGDGLRLAEIDAAGQLAQNHDVEALDQLALEARGVGERRIGHSRPQIGVERELLAQPQQPRLGPRIVGHLVPLRTAHRAEDHRVGGGRLRHGGVGDGDLVRVVGGAAHQPFLDVEPGDALLFQETDQPFHLGHDFRTDAVAGEQEELVGGHGWFPR
jgi:hypothetical protein